MTLPPTTRLASLLWLAAAALLAAVAVFPVSSRITRAGGVVLAFVVWFGWVALTWRHRRVRLALLAITVLGAGFLSLPGRALPDSAALRRDYIAGLRRYEGVRYFWGGESPKGIDCSGLVRRGLIDALFWRGLHTFDPGLIRRALVLWWHDCTAESLGGVQTGWTVRLLTTPSVNALDHELLLPGDLAVTSGGVHVMAYLGNQRWIEADQGVGRVVIVPVPSSGNVWFDMKMNIVRWSILQP